MQIIHNKGSFYNFFLLKKLITENNGQLQLTPAGLVVENEIITQLSL